MRKIFLKARNRGAGRARPAPPPPGGHSSAFLSIQATDSASKAVIADSMPRPAPTAGETVAAAVPTAS